VWRPEEPTIDLDIVPLACESGVVGEPVRVLRRRDIPIMSRALRHLLPDFAFDLHRQLLEGLRSEILE
jgi:hypothetical protein